MLHLRQVLEHQRQRITTESTEERETRLQQLRVNQHRRIATETTEQREARLQQLRSNQQQRITAEIAEEREVRLQQLQVNQQQRITAETTEEQQARLQQVRINQQQRIAAETTEERKARLQQLQVRQQERLAYETPEETEARRACDRQKHNIIQVDTSERPLFSQSRVHSKMAQFHLRLAALQMPRCVTCLERLPGMSIRALPCGETECLRCSRDNKHTPKLYSSANNSVSDRSAYQ